MRVSNASWALDEVIAVGPAAATHGPIRLPKIFMSGKPQNTGQRGQGGNEKKWPGYATEDLRMVDITGDWSITVLDPGA